MSFKKPKAAVVAGIVASGIAVAVTAYAVVGELLPKNLAQSIGLSLGVNAAPTVAEHVFVKYHRYYRPAQTADGALTTVNYNNADGSLNKTRDFAKPLISVFMYGPAYTPDPQVGTTQNTAGFVGHGRRDIYSTFSLDDGNTWKHYNLSDSALESSIQVKALPDPADQNTSITDYPGDAINVVHAVSGRNVVAAWPSRYCKKGTPAYTLDTTTTDPDDGSTKPTRDALATYLGVDVTKDLYLTDLFGVAGSQGSVDYAALTKDPYPTIGEVPYSCLWTARGVVVDGDDPRTAGVTESTHIVWFKPERLTSGVRDVNRVEIDMLAGAGAVVTWQEDPEGLRPGGGDGSGEGWSGATAGSKTDVWYSFLPWQHFDTVIGTDGAPVSLASYWTATDVTTSQTKPKVYVPFAVPMRLTNNDRCQADGITGKPYCYAATAAAYGVKDQCATKVSIPQGSGSATQEVCVSASGLPNVANTAATRPRLNLRPKLDASGATIGAWVVVIAEEDKGLGNFGYRISDPTVSCDADNTADTDCAVADDGKNIWYFSFDMGKPQTSADTAATGLVANLVGQGNMVNQPEVDWRTGTTYPPMNTADLWNFTTGNFQIYRTEIARRGALMTQPTSNVGGSKLMAMLLYKQGLINSGGPADIMARRIVNAGTSANPYDFSNLVCKNRLFADGSNPYYPKGICNDPAINLSGVTPQTCATMGGGTEDTSDGQCPTIDSSGIASSDPADQKVYDKLTTWIQCPGSPECGSNDLSTALGSNLDDQSWYNPLDVSKGHRGYLWGDQVVMMYAWSPNWKLNKKGSDRYELYVRRSFDGGRNWTTTPASWGGVGTTTCERMRDGATAGEATEVCTSYAAGAAEQARNVSQLQSADGTGTYKYTVLDPRYTPEPVTMPSISGTGTDPESDTHNPSRFFVVFETGDNTTTVDGEPEPMDLNYGRAVNFGDHYQITSEESTLRSSNTWINEFARLTTGSNPAAEEASLAMTPAGDTLYSVWAQEQGGVHEPRFNRVWYTDANFPVSVPTSTSTTEPVIGSPATSSSSSSGCSMGRGDAPFDPTLPLLAAAGLIGLGLRRARRS